MSTHGKDLTLNVTIFGGGAFGRWLHVGEVTWVEPHDGNSVLIGRGRDERPLSLPLEDIRRRQSASQEESPHQNLTLLYPDLDFPAPRTVRNKDLLFK